MQTTLLFGILIGLGFLLILIISFFPDEENNDRVDVRKRSENILFSWYSPNKTWVTTKIFIFGMSLLPIIPKYFIFEKGKELKNWGLNDILNVIKSLKVEIIPFETWTYGDIFFIIIYISVVLILINLPIRYTITNNDISYGFLGIEKVSQFDWVDAVCYDIYDGELHIWFKPPIYKPDWSIPVPKGNEEYIISIVSNYCVRYSVRSHTIK